MEAAVALFTTLATAGEAAATSAAAWAAGTTVTTAAGVTSTLAAGSSALSILQGVATAGSILSTVAGGMSDAAEAKTNAQMAELQGNQDYIDSERRALEIRRETARKVGAARVAFAASGLDISSGDAVVADLETQGTYQTGIEKQAGESRRIQSQMRARQYRASGDADLLGTVFKAGGKLAGFGIDIANRG